MTFSKLYTSHYRSCGLNDPVLCIGVRCFHCHFGVCICMYAGSCALLPLYLCVLNWVFLLGCNSIHRFKQGVKTSVRTSTAA